MKFTCNTQTLSTACQNVQRAVSSKTSIPSLEGVLLKALGNELIITGYDLEIGITTSIEANVSQQGCVVLNAKVFSEILRRMPQGTVSIESNDYFVTSIKCGEVKYELSGYDASEYPELPSVTGGFPIVVDKEMLSEMVRQTIFAVAVNDAKVVHTGIKIEISTGEIKLIAVDGFRLAVRTEPIDYTGEDISFVVPSKAMSEIVKLMEGEEKTVSISLGKRHITFEVNNYCVVSRLLEGEFLNYKAAIPANVSTTVIVNTNDLMQAISRTSLIIVDQTKSPLRCVFDNNYINISSLSTIGSANDRVEAKIEGQRVEIGFNNRFLLDALRYCGTDEVIIQLGSSVSPILILPPAGNNFTFLILPVRIKNENQ